MKNNQAERHKSTAREYTEAIVIALILALFIRTFIVQAFKIPSGSMLQTLLIGDHILVSKFIYGIKNPFTGAVLLPIKSPKRGDIVVFKYPKDPKLDYIKRVIATAGDTLEIKNKKVFINGAPPEDHYGEFRDAHILPPSEGPRDNFGPVTVPAGHIFVMGDNRDNSYDSRFWGFVNLEAVRGKAFIIYWSWDVKKSLLSWERLSSVRWSRIGDILH
ncbi:MAG: signal peptidase I [Candidatus Electrothrix sp. GW3-4]|uniref:signal peptidase I n=1 Tax=Candidatus Electrothrix sp. GW3-4 TaxID=3126740 RepID=UPI0030CA91AA